MGGYVGGYVCGQTPRVFHPALRGEPWWDPAAFSLTAELEAMHARHGGPGEGQVRARMVFGCCERGGELGRVSG